MEKDNKQKGQEKNEIKAPEIQVNLEPTAKIGSFTPESPKNRPMAN